MVERQHSAKSEGVTVTVCQGSSDKVCPRGKKGKDSLSQSRAAARLGVRLKVLNTRKRAQGMRSVSLLESS